MTSVCHSIVTTKKRDGESVAKKKKSGGGCPFYKQDPLKEYTDRTLVGGTNVTSIRYRGKGEYIDKTLVGSANITSIRYRGKGNTQTEPW